MVAHSTVLFHKYIVFTLFSTLYLVIIIFLFPFSFHFLFRAWADSVGFKDHTNNWPNCSFFALFYKRKNNLIIDASIIAHFLSNQNIAQKRRCIFEVFFRGVLFSHSAGRFYLSQIWCNLCVLSNVLGPHTSRVNNPIYIF